jgi:hypothetical protein
VVNSKTKPDPRKINVFIAGAQKAGTSSLNNYLAQHPDIISPHYEMMYFLSDIIFSGGYEQAFKRYYRQYKSEKIILAKNVGLLYSPIAKKRLFDHNPEVKIILILRNPVDRAFSSYLYARQMGWEDCDDFQTALRKSPLDYQDLLARRNCAYLERGRYAEHIIDMYQFFPKENISLYFLQELKDAPVQLCSNIFNEIGAATFTVTTDKRFNVAKGSRFPRLMNYVSHPSKIVFFRKLARKLIPGHVRDSIRRSINRLNEVDLKQKPMTQETRKILLDYYKPFNQQLEELIEIDLSNWNI